MRLLVAASSVSNKGKITNNGGRSPRTTVVRTWNVQSFIKNDLADERPPVSTEKSTFNDQPAMMAHCNA